MAKSALRKYFTLGGCCSPESKIFLFGRVWRSCNNNAHHGQINGSIWEVLMLVDSEAVARVSGAAETVDYFG